MSAIYRGTVQHRRKHPVAHAFRYPVGMLFVDLDAFGVLEHPPLWSARRAAPGRLRSEDYLSAADVRGRTGATGRVFVLTTPRTFGRSFNPVSFYYAFDGDTLHSVVAEVTNTPWGEKHCYVVRTDAEVTEATLPKAFHVSPFLGMEGSYRWRLTAPGPKLLVHLELDDDFDATLTLTREPLTAAGLRRLLLRFPLQSARTGVLIYLNALRLKLKGAPYFRHPEAAA